MTSLQPRPIPRRPADIPTADDSGDADSGSETPLPDATDTCPVCGVDLSHLAATAAGRTAHVNGCLDNMQAEEFEFEPTQAVPCVLEPQRIDFEAEYSSGLQQFTLESWCAACMFLLAVSLPVTARVLSVACKISLPIFFQTERTKSHVMQVQQHMECKRIDGSHCLPPPQAAAPGPGPPSSRFRVGRGGCICSAVPEPSGPGRNRYRLRRGEGGADDCTP